MPSYRDRKYQISYGGFSYVIIHFGGKLNCYLLERLYFNFWEVWIAETHRIVLTLFSILLPFLKLNSQQKWMYRAHKNHSQNIWWAMEMKRGYYQFCSAFKSSSYWEDVSIVWVLVGETDAKTDIWKFPPPRPPPARGPWRQ